MDTGTAEVDDDQTRHQVQTFKGEHQRFCERGRLCIVDYKVTGTTKGQQFMKVANLSVKARDNKEKTGHTG
jgi:hypothetical protein